MSITRIQFRRGTAAEWDVSDVVLDAGEPGFEEDTGIVKVGDGATLWADLPALVDSSALAGFQPLDADLTAIAALTTTTYGRALLTLANQAALTALLPAASETVAGKVELATQAETNTGTDDARAVTPLKLQTRLAAYAQPLDADLTAIAALATTTYGRALLTMADAAAARTALALGTAATVNTGTGAGNVPVLNASGRLDIARLASGAPDGTKFVRDDGVLATPSGGGGGISKLASAKVEAGTTYTISSTTFADVSAGSLVCTFVGPASGQVKVRLAGFLTSSASGVIYGIRDASGMVAKSAVGVTDSAVTGRFLIEIPLTVTPAASYTWKWAWRLVTGATSSTLFGDNGVGSNRGPILMEVWSD